MRRTLLATPLAAVLVIAGCSKATGTAATAPVPSGPVMPAAVTALAIATGDSIFARRASARRTARAWSPVPGSTAPASSTRS